MHLVVLYGAGEEEFTLSRSCGKQAHRAKPVANSGWLLEYIRMAVVLKNLAGTSKLTGLAFAMSLTWTRVTQVSWLI